MGLEGLDFEALEGVSPSFVESLYRRYRDDPGSVGGDWQKWFAGLEENSTGPSWARDNWPLQNEDALTAALDPTQMQPEAKSVPTGKTEKAVAVLDSEGIAKGAGDSIRAMMLIRTYRVRGHLATELDPLGLSTRELPADLTPEYHGFPTEDHSTGKYIWAASWASRP